MTAETDKLYVLDVTIKSLKLIQVALISNPNQVNLGPKSNLEVGAKSCILLSCYWLSLTQRWRNYSHMWGLKLHHSPPSIPFFPSKEDFVSCSVRCIEWHLFQCWNAHVFSTACRSGRSEEPSWAQFKGRNRWTIWLFWLEDSLAKSHAWHHGGVRCGPITKWQKSDEII